VDDEAAAEVTALKALPAYIDELLTSEVVVAVRMVSLVASFMAADDIEVCNVDKSTAAFRLVIV
jgi:hypothetical protein